jgi:hypothetical protein
MTKQVNEEQFLSYTGVKLLLNKMKDYFVPYKNSISDSDLSDILTEYFSFFGSGSGSGSGGLAMALEDEAESVDSGSGQMLAEALDEETNE